MELLPQDESQLDSSPLRPAPMIRPPSPAQQSWGTIVSIVIIIGMIVVGAFYAWGKRISDQQSYSTQPSSTATQ